MTTPRSSGRVIVVGSVNIDLVVTTDRLPGPGETVTGGRLARHHGGKGGNQAVAAARLGAEVAFVGAVGDDAFGDEARAALALDGVDLAELITVPGVSTGVALILVDAKGENLISVASGANGEVEPETVVAALGRLRIGSGDVVLVGHEIPTRSVAAALAAGRGAGAMTILNPAPADGLDAATLASADVLTPNERELEILRRAGLPTGGAWLVSLGADGARLEASGTAVSIPALPVRAVDTVGAGDTLNGALAAALAAGHELEAAARRAVAAASLSVTRAGAREGMPTTAELEAISG